MSSSRWPAGRLPRAVFGDLAIDSIKGALHPALASVVMRVSLRAENYSNRLRRDSPEDWEVGSGLVPITTNRGLNLHPRPQGFRLFIY